mgnify:CR=1 FL=1
MEKQNIIKLICSELMPILQSGHEQEAFHLIDQALTNVELIDRRIKKPKTNKKALRAFINSKEIEGCSKRSLTYYSYTISKFFKTTNKPYFLVETEDIRNYLSYYKENNNVSSVTIDNTRRAISSLFSWLEDENYIAKNPVKRIHKIKVVKVVKPVFSEETIELLKERTKNIRDLAIVEFLYSTGVRVGELVQIKIAEIDFDNRECVVLGKGNKQRKVYFDSKTKLHLLEYISLRKGNSEYLFLSLNKPYNRLEISGVEIMLRKLGNLVGIKGVFPHKFRRTIATKAIDKGMPIEQVQHMLGHTKIDTTLEYAMVDDINVKLSHKKYLE